MVKLLNSRVRFALYLGIVVSLLAACNLNLSNLGLQPTQTPVPTPDIPVVEILDPPNNRQVVEGTVFDIDIVARDAGSGIARVELLVDGEVINEAGPVDDLAVPVYRVTMNWRAGGPGFHVIEAVAYRLDGRRGDAAVLNIEVLPRE